MGSGNTVSLAQFGRNVTISIMGKNNRIEGVTLDDANGIIIEAGNNDAASLKASPNILKNVNVKIKPPSKLDPPSVTKSLLPPKQAVIVRAAYTKIEDSEIEATNATALYIQGADGVVVLDTVLKGTQPLYIKDSNNVVVSAPKLKALGKRSIDSTESFAVNWTARGDESTNPQESPYCEGGMKGTRTTSFAALPQATRAEQSSATPAPFLGMIEAADAPWILGLLVLLAGASYYFWGRKA